MKTKKNKKIKKNIDSGKVYIKATYNNTMVYITDFDGNVLLWSTAGKEGFKGSKKSTPYAAQIASKSLAKKAKDDYKMNSAEVYVKGPGPGREASIRGIGNFIKITTISDITSIPHNGCRPPKERRV